MSLSRFFGVLTLALCWPIFIGDASAQLSGKREPHLRLKAKISERETLWRYDRWFMPGRLGYEPAAPSERRKSQSLSVERVEHEDFIGAHFARRRPELSDSAFWTRALGGVDKEWGEFNQLTPRLNFSHNLGRIVPRELFDEQPELFPLIDEKRWRPKPGRVNWNPDLGEPATAELAVLAADEYFKENPGAVSFALGVNDGLRFGESPATLEWIDPVRWFRNRPDYSDLVFQFMNGVAQRLEPSWSDKHVGALAYYWAENVPSFSLHPQVLPYLTADRSQFYDAGFRREELELQRRWANAFVKSERLNAEKVILDQPHSDPDGSPLTAVSSGPRLGIYDYIYGVGFLVPRIHTEYLSYHLRHARTVGFTDYYAEMSPNWGIDGPQPWLVAQLLLDPEADFETMLDEYYARFFKTASVPMRRFFERCEEQWVNQTGASYWLKHFKNDSQAKLFPSGVSRELRTLLNDALRQAECSGNEVVIERIRFVRVAWGLTERYVAFCEARNELQELLLALAKEGTGNSERDSMANFLEQVLVRYQQTRIEFKRYAEWIQEEHPLAFTRVLLDIFVRHDPGPTAEVELVRISRENAQKDAKTTERSADSRSQSSDRGFRIHGWEGELQPGLEIAGLPFELALPRGWRSSVEPWLRLLTEMRPLQQSGRGAGGVLRLENHKLTSIIRGYHAPSTAVGRELGNWGIAVDVRGRLSETALLNLTLRPYDENMQALGPAVDTKLTAGDHGQWTQLVQFPVIPEGTRYLGLTLWCAHQQAGDWLEIGEPRVISNSN